MRSLRFPTLRLAYCVHWTRSAPVPPVQSVLSPNTKRSENSGRFFIASFSFSCYTLFIINCQEEYSRGMSEDIADVDHRPSYYYPVLFHQKNQVIAQGLMSLPIRKWFFFYPLDFLMARMNLFKKVYSRFFLALTSIGARWNCKPSHAPSCFFPANPGFSFAEASTKSLTSANAKVRLCYSA